MDKLKTYLKALSPTEQAELAGRFGTTIGYIRKSFSTGQLLGEKVCVRVEQETSGAVTRRDLRPNDWQKIWPELALPSAERSCAAIETQVPGVANV